MRYNARLDAMRGLCIGAVFLCHAQFFEIGWIGVQAFFVLSGYLITGVLLEGKISAESLREFLAAFYMRRALRIFPVYFAYLAAVFLLASSLPGWIAAYARSIIESNAPYLLTYTFNFHRAAMPDAKVGPFVGHLWSLSVEEQFYLVWPFVVYTSTRHRLASMCMVMALSGPLIRLLEAAWLLRIPPHSMQFAAPAILFSSFSHVDAFALGALLNFAGEDARVRSAIRFLSRWAPPAFVLATALLFVLLRFSHVGDMGISSFGWGDFLSHYSASVWGYSVLNALFFVFIARLDDLPPFLDSRWLQRLGRMSYGFYIFHFPIFGLLYNLSPAYGSNSGIGWLVIPALAFALTWLLSAASYRYLESPLLRFRPRSVPATEPA